MRNVTLVLGLIGSLLSCTFREKPAETVATPNALSGYKQQIEEARILLKDGDLLVRNGNDLTSQFIKNFSKKDKNYSHSGLVFFKGDKPLVYHILASGGSAASELFADSLEAFCDPRHNSAFALYRYDLNAAELEKLRAAVFNWYDKGVKFDSMFNLKTDDRMYCSEMIKKGLEQSTNNRITMATVRPTKNDAVLAATRLPLSVEAMQQLDIVPIDHLYMNPNCRLVQRYEFHPAK